MLFENAVGEEVKTTAQQDTAVVREHEGQCRFPRSRAVNGVCFLVFISKREKGELWISMVVMCDDIVIVR